MGFELIDDVGVWFEVLILDDGFTEGVADTHDAQGAVGRAGNSEGEAFDGGLADIDCIIDVGTLYGRVVLIHDLKGVFGHELGGGGGGEVIGAGQLTPLWTYTADGGASRSDPDIGGTGI